MFLSITERGTGDARGTIFCNLVAISPEAGMVGNHRKLIPTFDERLVWGFGDGFGLEAYDVKGAKAGGLNCWENWMPLARYALYCGGEDIHVSTWPGADAEATRIVKTIAKEGRVWSIAPSGILSIDDIPTSFALYDEIRESGETQFFNGGSSIVDPCGNYVVGPILDKEQLLIADIDLDIVRQERQSFDPSGHYSRPDVFEFVVNRQRQHRVRYIDSDPEG